MGNGGGLVAGGCNAGVGVKPGEPTKFSVTRAGTAGVPAKRAEVAKPSLPAGWGDAGQMEPGVMPDAFGTEAGVTANDGEAGLSSLRVP